MAGPFKRERGGVGVNGRAIKEQITFFNLFFQRSKIPTAIKLEKEGGLGLNGH